MKQNNVWFSVKPQWSFRDETVRYTGTLTPSRYRRFLQCFLHVCWSEFTCKPCRSQSHLTNRRLLWRPSGSKPVSYRVSEVWRFLFEKHSTQEELRRAKLRFQGVGAMGLCTWHDQSLNPLVSLLKDKVWQLHQRSVVLYSFCLSIEWGQSFVNFFLCRIIIIILIGHFN